MPWPRHLSRRGAHTLSRHPLRAEASIVLRKMDTSSSSSHSRYQRRRRRHSDALSGRIMSAPRIRGRRNLVCCCLHCWEVSLCSWKLVRSLRGKSCRLRHPCIRILTLYCLADYCLANCVCSRVIQCLQLENGVPMIPSSQYGDRRSPERGRRRRSAKRVRTPSRPLLKRLGSRDIWSLTGPCLAS
jgi:hypothetical protein